MEQYGAGSSMVAIYDSMTTVLSSFASGTSDATKGGRGTNVYYYIPTTVDVKTVYADDTLGATAVTDVYYMVLRDNPQYFWLVAPIISYTRNSATKEITAATLQFRVNIDYYTYAARKEVQDGYNAAIETMKTSTSKRSAFETARIVHDYVCDITTYQTEYANQLMAGGKVNYSYQGVGGVFGLGQAVCEGYAKAYQLLMNALGYECITVVGRGGIGNSAENHMWNMVKLSDGGTEKWFYVDVTWDDPATEEGSAGKYAYFAVPETAFFTVSHVPGLDGEYQYPLPAASVAEHSENTYLYETQNPDGMFHTTVGDFKVVAPRLVELVSIPNEVANLSSYTSVGVFRDSSRDNDEDGTCYDVCAYALTGIGEGVFRNCRALGEVNLTSKYLTYIGDNAFRGASSLHSVSVASTALKTIGDYAFADTTSLYVAANSGLFSPALKSVGTYAFSNTAFENNAADFSHTVLETIGTDAFAGTYLYTLMLPNTLTRVTASDIHSPNLGVLTVAEGGKYVAENGILFNATKRELIYAAPYASALYSYAYTVPSTVNTIAAHAFENTKAYWLTLPDSVQVIGEGAFENCTRLQYVRLPAHLTAIPENAFTNSALSTVTIPANVTSIGSGAFSGSTQLSEVVFAGKAPSTFGTNVFYHCGEHLRLCLDATYLASWNTAYNVSDCTWNGIPAYFTYQDTGYVIAVDANEFDTKDMHGQMRYEDGVWTSLAERTYSRITTLEYPQSGSFVFRAKVSSDMTHSAGLAFFMNEAGTDFYRISIKSGQVTLARFTGDSPAETNGTGLLTVSMDGYTYNGGKAVQVDEYYRTITTNTYNVFWDTQDYVLTVTAENGVIQGYVNGIRYIYYVVDDLAADATGFGFYAVSENVEFSDVTLRVSGEGSLTFRNPAESGAVSVTDRKITFADGTLAEITNEYDGNSRFFMQGNLTGSGTGFVFALNTQQEYISYYSLFLSADGMLILQRHQDGGVTDITRVEINGFDENAAYCVALLRDENLITVTLDGTTVIEYTEPERLDGTGYGLIGNSNGSVTRLSVRFKNDYSRLDENHTNRQGIYFTLDDETMTAWVGDRNHPEILCNTGYTDANYGVVEIPESVKLNGLSYTVVGIAPGAFTGNTVIKTIRLPESISYIGFDAFNGCSSLVKAVFKGDAPSVVGGNGEKCMFTSCHPQFNIEALSTSSGWGITYLYPAWHDFIAVYSDDPYYYDILIVDADGYNAEGIRFQEIEDGVKVMSGSMYTGANDGVVILPTNVAWNGKILPVTEIATKAFQNCGMVNIVIPDSVVIMEQYAFAYCYNLGADGPVILPANLTKMAPYLFLSCTSLKEVVIGNRVTTVGEGAFSNTGLTSVTFPESVSYIGNGAFQNATSLVSVTLPDGLRQLSANTFSGCTGLETVVLPDSMQEICERAFAGCTKLQTVSLNLENSRLDSIDAYAFAGCSSLVSVELPASMKYFGERAFNQCTSLTDMWFNGKKPTFDSEVFGLVNDAVVLHYYEELNDENWTFPYIAEGYFSTPRTDTYTGKNGVIMKYLKLDGASDLWMSANGVHTMLLSSGASQSVATIVNHVPSAGSLVILEADVTAGSDPQASYGLMICVDFHGNQAHAVNSATGYFLSIGTDGRVSLIKRVNGTPTVLASETQAIPAFNATKTYYLNVRYDSSTGEFHCFINGVLFFRLTDDEPLSDGLCAFCASGTDMKFQNAVLTEIGDVLDFSDRQGSLQNDADAKEMIPTSVPYLGIVANYPYNRLASFHYMTTVQGTGAVGENGMVFGYSETATESGTVASYYRLVISNSAAGAQLILYRAVDGEETLVARELLRNTFDVTEPHTVKTMWNAAGDLDSYLDGVWVFKYLDSEPLTGSDYGLYSSDAGASFCETYMTISGNNSTSSETEYSPLTEAHTNKQGIRFTLDDSTMTAIVGVPGGGAGNAGYTGNGAVVIPDVVTLNDLVYRVVGIARFAFEDSQLQTVTIPDGVVSIGEAAFENCTNLSAVAMPSGLRVIESRTFYGCSALREIYIPEFVESIGDSAYAFCNSVTVVTIPKNVSQIAPGAFRGCDHLMSFGAEDGGYFSAKSGVLYDFEKTMLVAYPMARIAESFVIPDTVVRVEAYAFFNSHLIEVTFGKNVSELGEYAFIFNERLVSVELTDAMESIGEYTFASCTSLVSVILPANLKTIGTKAFYDCSALSSVDLPEGLLSVGESAFENCTALVRAVLPKSLESIGKKAWMASGLTSLSIPNGVSDIGKDAFAGCGGLTALSIGSGVADLSCFDFASYLHLERITVDSANIAYASDAVGALYSKDGSVLYFLPDNDSLFSFVSEGKAEEIRYWTLPSGVLVIADNAIVAPFAGAQIYVPATVTDIGEGNFIRFVGDVLANEETAAAAYLKAVNGEILTVLENLTADRIAVTSIPTRFEYSIGKEPDFTGLEIRTEYYNGKKLYVTRTESYLLDEYDPEIVGEQAVHVSVGEELETEFTIYYAEKTVSHMELTPPDKTEYMLDEAFDFTGLVAVLHYDNGDTETLDPGAYEIAYEPYAPLGTSRYFETPGEYTLAVRYKTSNGTLVTATFDVNVLNKKVVSIVVNWPEKDSYRYGESLDVRGISIMLRYNTGEVAILTYGTDYDLTGFDPELLGVQELNLRLFGIELDAGVKIPVFEVTVNKIKPDRPEAPSLSVATKDTIVVVVTENVNPLYTYSYSICRDGEWSDWQASGSFTGLAANHTYQFRVRINKAEGLSYNENDENMWSVPVSYKTQAKRNDEVPGKPSVSEETDEGTEKIRIVVTPNPSDNPREAFKYQYSVNGLTWSDSGEFTGLDGKKEYHIYVRYAANDEYSASEKSEMLIYTTGKYTPDCKQPRLSSVTAHSIELIAGQEGSVSYRIGTLNTESGEYTWSDWQEDGEFTGLTAYSDYYFQCRASETDITKVSTPSDPVRVRTEKEAPAAPIEVLVDRDYDAYTLTVQTPDDGFEMRFVLMLGEEIVETSPSGVTYTFENLLPNSEYRIAAIYSYDLTDEFEMSSEMGEALVVTTGKLYHSPLTAPELDSKTTTTVTLKTDDTVCEFSMDGVNWQASPVFEDLKEYTVYTFYRRYAEDETYEAGDYDENAVLTVRTKMTMATYLEQVLGTSTPVFESGLTLDEPIWAGSRSNHLDGWDTNLSFQWYADGAPQENYRTVAYGQANNIEEMEEYAKAHSKVDHFSYSPVTQVDPDTQKETFLYYSVTYWSVDSDNYWAITRQEISLTVTGTGEVEGEYTFPGIKPEKGTQEAPIIVNVKIGHDPETGLPTYLNVDTNYIDWDEGGNLEYRCEELCNGQWQDSHYFYGGIVAGETYHFYARQKETDYFHASESSGVFTVVPTQIDVEVPIEYFDIDASIVGDTKFGEQLRLDIKSVNTNQYEINWTLYEYVQYTNTETYASGFKSQYDSGKYYSYRASLGSEGYCFLYEDYSYYPEEYVSQGSNTVYGVSRDSTGQYRYDNGGNYVYENYQYAFKNSFYGYYVIVTVTSTDPDHPGFVTFTSEIIDKASQERIKAPVVQNSNITAGTITVDPLLVPVYSTSVSDFKYRTSDCFFRVPVSGTLVYCVRITENGVEISMDNGVTWPVVLQDGVRVNGLGTSVKMADGLLKYSVDGGLHWGDTDCVYIDIAGKTVTVKQFFADVQYSDDGGVSWQSSNRFIYLENGKEYSILARLAQTATYYASEASDATAVTTKLVGITTPDANDVRSYIQATNNSIDMVRGSIEITADNVCYLYDADEYYGVFAKFPAIAAMEYSLDGTHWYTETVFTNLEMYTEYTLYYRVAATELTAASEAGSVVVRTKKNPQNNLPDSPTVLEIGDHTIVIDSMNSCEFSLDGKKWQTTEVFENLKANTQYTIRVRYMETDLKEASAAVSLTVRTLRSVRESAPVGFTANDFCDSKTTDSLWMDAKNLYEFSRDGETWGTYFTGLEPNREYTFFIRYRENNEYFVSESAPMLGTVLTPKYNGTAPTIVPRASIITATSVTLADASTDEVTYQYYVLAGKYTTAAASLFEEDKWQDDPYFSGLTENTTYTFFVRLKETDTTYASPAGSGTSYVTKQMLLEGSVDIGFVTGSTVSKYCYGATLSVDLSGLSTVTDDFTYQWLLNGVAITGETRSVYVVRASDIGKNISVRVTGDATCPGEITSGEVTITKGYVSKPGVPSLYKAMTAGTTIAVRVESGCEYSVNGAEWKTPEAGATYVLFEELYPDMTYTVYQRKAETDTMFASESTSITHITEKNKAAAPTAFAVLDSNSYSVTISTENGCSYRLSGNNVETDWVTPGDGTLTYSENLLPGLSYRLYAKRNETLTYRESDTIMLTVTLPKNPGPAAPTKAPGVISVTANSVTLESDSRYEYRVVNGKWQDSNVITGLSPNKSYSFEWRIKETAFQLASGVGPAVTTKTDKETPTDIPDAPTLSAYYDLSIQLKGTKATMEYCLFVGEYNALTDSVPMAGWVSETYGTFAGTFTTDMNGDPVRPDTVYTVLCRVRETSTAYAGPLATPLEVRTLKHHTIRFFLDEEKTELYQTLEFYDGQAVSVKDPTKEDLKYVYTFLNWNEDVVRYAYADADYYAVFDCVYIPYTIEFYDEAGKLLSSEVMHYGDVIVPPDAPVKPDTVSLLYSFAGWKTQKGVLTVIDAEHVVTVTSDVEYTASYASATRYYSVTFYDEDGSVLLTGQYEYGTLTVFPETPVKASEQCCEYVFDGWTPASLDFVTADAEYTATYRGTFYHEPGDWIVDTDATCWQVGSRHKACGVCQQTVMTEEIPQLAHDLANVGAQTPGCETIGWEAYCYCQRTECSYTTYVEIPALSHDLIPTVYNPTCLDGGYTHYQCSRCTYAYDGDYKTALDHNYVPTVTPPTCTEAGYTTWQCSRCESNYVNTPVNALNHDWVETDRQNPTCVDDGYVDSACSRCPAEKHEVLDALDHDYVDHDAKTADCEHIGWNAYKTCSRCDYTTYAELPALEHNFVNYVCTRCGTERNGMIVVNGKTYFYENHKRVEGWFTFEGKTYYASRNDFTIVDHDVKIGGRKYVWNDETGLELLRGIVEVEGKFYCYEDGIQVFGWRHADGTSVTVTNDISEQYSENPQGLYYFLSTTMEMVTDASYRIGGYDRQFNADHTVQPINGLQNKGGFLYYYVNGVRQTGFVTIGEQTYYFLGNSEERGRAATKWRLIGSRLYYFYATTSETPYVLKTSGSIGGISYQYAEDGHILYNGFANPDYANVSNKNTKAYIQKQNETAYYLVNGEMQYGWQDIGGKRYYFYNRGSANGEGRLCCTSRKIGGVYYTFDENGALIP